MKMEKKEKNAIRKAGMESGKSKVTKPLVSLIKDLTVLLSSLNGNSQHLTSPSEITYFQLYQMIIF